MSWRIKLIDYLEAIYKDLGFETFGSWNLQNNEETADIFPNSNALLLNVEFSNRSVVYNSSSLFFTIEDFAEFELFVLIKNKNFNLEKTREIFDFCDKLQKRMLQNDSEIGDIYFLGESAILPHTELMIRSQRYSLRVVEEVERVGKPIPVQAGEIQKINKIIC